MSRFAVHFVSLPVSRVLVISRYRLRSRSPAIESLSGFCRQNGKSTCPLQYLQGKSTTTTTTGIIHLPAGFFTAIPIFPIQLILLAPQPFLPLYLPKIRSLLRRFLFPCRAFTFARPNVRKNAPSLCEVPRLFGSDRNAQFDSSDLTEEGKQSAFNCIANYIFN